MDSHQASAIGPKQAARAASIGRAHETVAGFAGLIVHRVAAFVRRAIFATAQADPANIGVLCDSFLRTGSEQAIGLRQTGLNVTLYYVDRVNSFAYNEEERTLILDRAEAAGVELVSLPRRRLQALFTQALWLHRDMRRRKIATAVVHAHVDPRYATLGLALPVALIVHDPRTHSGDTASTFSRPVRAIARFAELTSACLIIHSTVLTDQIQPLLRRVPLGVIPLGADMAPAPVPVPRERQLLVFGRLFAYKGVDTALDALRLLPEEMSDVKLIVAGRGPLAEMARGRPDVELRDEYIAESDIDILLDRVRLVLLPYKDATQSAVGMLAVARGVPCVVSRSGGLPELVQDSAPSLVVPPDDPARLAEAISAHLEHDEDLRRAIYDHAATCFALPVAAQRLRSELHRLGLDGSRSPIGVAP